MAPFIHPHNYDSNKHHHSNPSNKPTTTTNWFLCCFGCSSVDRSKNRVLNQSHPEEDRGCICIGNDHKSSSSRSGEKENTGSSQKKKRKKKKKFKYLKFVYWPVCRIHRAMKNPSKKNKLVNDNDQQLLHTQTTKDVKGNNSSYEIVEVPDIDYDILQASRLIHTSLGVSVAGAANESPYRIQRMKNKPMINVDRVSKLKTQQTVATKTRSDKRKCNKDGSGSQNHKRRSTSNKFPYTDDGGIIDHKHPVIGMFILAVTLVIMVLCGPLCAILCTSACFYCIPWLVKLDNGINMVYGGGRDGDTDTNNNKQRDDNSSGVNISSELYRKKVVFEGFSRRDRRLL